jgi:hypothetical protein
MPAEWSLLGGGREPIAGKLGWKQISHHCFQRLSISSCATFEVLFLPPCRHLDLDELAGR